MLVIPHEFRWESLLCQTYINSRFSPISFSLISLNRILSLRFEVIKALAPTLQSSNYHVPYQLHIAFSLPLVSWLRVTETLQRLSTVHGRSMLRISCLLVSLKFSVEVLHTYTTQLSSSQPSSATTKTSGATFAQDRLVLFESDRTRTTVPFYYTKDSTEQALIRAAESRIAEQINAFDDTFDGSNNQWKLLVW